MVQNGLAAKADQGGRRRMRSKLERRQVVEETMRPGAPSVAVIARAHGVNAQSLYCHPWFPCAMPPAVGGQLTDCAPFGGEHENCSRKRTGLGKLADDVASL